MASECVCETDGWCEPCRGDGTPVFSHEEATKNRCVWCKEWFDHDDTFVLGDYANAQRVCGSACPKRPPQPKPKRKPKVRGLERSSTQDRAYVVTIVVDVPMWAHNGYAARRRATRLIRGKHRVGIISSSVKRKAGLSDTT